MEARRDVFQAIADPTRRQIIDILARGEQPVQGIASHFGMSRQAISLHLQILKECELIQVRQEGRSSRCSLRPQKLQEADQWLASHRHLWEEKLNALKEFIEKTP